MISSCRGKLLNQHKIEINNIIIHYMSYYILTVLSESWCEQSSNRFWSYERDVWSWF